MKKIAVIAAVALACLVAVGCTKKAGGAVAAKTADGTVRIALIIENTIDDKGWCQAMYDGLVTAKAKLGGKLDFSYSEKMLPVDAGSAARQYAAQGYNIIIAHGAQYKNLIMEMAEEYPAISFAFGTSAEIGPANVFTYMPESEETGYINGIIAGLTTRTNQVGVVGPVDGGDAARYNRGFVLGVQSVNSNAKIAVAHTGSFSDYVKAGEVAQTQIGSGVDALTGSSQQAIGALQVVGDSANANRWVWWFGQDLAQFGTDAGKTKCVAASSYNYASVILGMVAKQEAGIKGGECIPMNFNNDGFVFEYNQILPDMVPADITANVGAALTQCRTAAGTLNWSAVDYSKL
jgi:basic membrane protein A